MKKNKKPKKITKKKQKSMARTAKRKQLSEWSRAVRLRDGKCMICGRLDHLNSHHILGKEGFPQFQFCINNGIALCSSCHRFSRTHSAHRSGIFFSEWLRINRPEQFILAVSRIQEQLRENNSK